MDMSAMVHRPVKSIRGLLLPVCAIVFGFAVLCAIPTSQKVQDTPLQVQEKSIGPNTYTNINTIKFTLQYPIDWRTSTHGFDVGITLKPINGTDFISLFCPITDLKNPQVLPNSYESEPNEGSYTTKYQKKLTINGMQAIQYIWGPADGETNELHTALLRNGTPVVCEFFVRISKSNIPYDEQIRAQTTYNEIVQSFRFLP